MWYIVAFILGALCSLIYVWLFSKKGNLFVDSADNQACSIEFNTDPKAFKAKHFVLLIVKHINSQK